MKKKKLSLESLKVQSFITSTESWQLKGGASLDDVVQCVNTAIAGAVICGPSIDSCPTLPIRTCVNIHVTGTGCVSQPVAECVPTYVCTGTGPF